MKSKADFVTNSSSCSFVGWGIILYEYDIKKDENLMKLLDLDSNEKYIYDTLYSYLSKENLDLMSTPWDSYLIGLQYSEMLKNETREDFEKSVEEKLKKLGFTKEASYISESWYDG